MKRSRNRDATKGAILRASLACLAAEGADEFSLVTVAELAGVNRSTVYDYYETRENLIRETRDWMSGELFNAVFGDIKMSDERPFEGIDVLALNARLAKFAMDNPELCQVWLTHVLSMPNPAQDPFWREYEGALERFARTDAAQPDVDAEVFTVILLAGTFIWPILVRARTRSTKKMHDESQRYLREWHRLALFGVSRPESFPELVKSVQSARPSKKKAR